MTKIIKRYANRKLYDTEQSTYVTLDEIEQMIKDGEEVRIVDNASKEDITHVTLAHIIFEQEKSSKGKLPISALRNIIQQSSEEFMQRIQSPVTQFKDEFRKRAEVVGEGGKALRDFVEGTQKSIDDMQRRIDDRMRDAVDQLTHIPELRRDSQLTEARIERLEARIRDLERTVSRVLPSQDATASDPHRDIPDPTRRFP